MIATWHSVVVVVVAYLGYLVVAASLSWRANIQTAKSTGFPYVVARESPPAWPIGSPILQSAAPPTVSVTVH